MPQIDNGFAVASTNVSFGGSASYQCYAGFGFPSGDVIETIVCTADGSWSYTPVCQASRCPQLDTIENGKGEILAGRGSNYGTILRYTTHAFQSHLFLAFFRILWTRLLRDSHLDLGIETLKENSRLILNLDSQFFSENSHSHSQLSKIF